MRASLEDVARGLLADVARGHCSRKKMELISVRFSFLTGQAIPEFENPRSAYSRWVTATVRYSGLHDNGKRKQSDDRLPHKLGGPRSLEVSRSLCKDPRNFQDDPCVCRRRSYRMLLFLSSSRI